MQPISQQEKIYSPKEGWFWVEVVYLAEDDDNNGELVILPEPNPTLEPDAALVLV